MDYVKTTRYFSQLTTLKSNYLRIGFIFCLFHFVTLVFVSDNIFYKLATHLIAPKHF